MEESGGLEPHSHRCEPSVFKTAPSTCSVHSPGEEDDGLEPHTVVPCRFHRPTAPRGFIFRGARGYAPELAVKLSACRSCDGLFGERSREKGL